MLIVHRIIKREFVHMYTFFDTKFGLFNQLQKSFLSEVSANNDDVESRVQHTRDFALTYDRPILGSQIVNEHTQV